MTVPIPTPPLWSVDWKGIEVACPWLADLAGCPQDPAYHAEGDVLVHTRMVVEAMAALPAWRALPEEEREVLFLAAVTHDLGKPKTTVIETDGRIRSPGHSLKGALLARAWMYRAGFNPKVREAVARLVRYHQLAFHLLDREDPRRAAYRASLATRCDHLAILAEADVRGRRAADLPKLLDEVALFREYCREEGCLDRPHEFPTPHSRFVYYRAGNRPPDVEAYDDTVCEAVLMHGIPASGKDTWIAKHGEGLPVVSLDQLRVELDVDPEDAQGPVAERARELAKEHLRAKRSFVLNATTISRDLRHRWTSSSPTTTHASASSGSRRPTPRSWSAIGVGRRRFPSGSSRSSSTAGRPRSRRRLTASTGSVRRISSSRRVPMRTASDAAALAAVLVWCSACENQCAVRWQGRLGLDRAGHRHRHSGR
ncbi:MAG: HD domain-containing protein [Myxococcales bacterium]